MSHRLPVSALFAARGSDWRYRVRAAMRRQATVIHGPNATHIGTDSFGNKYYQRLTEQFGAP